MLRGRWHVFAGRSRWQYHVEKTAKACGSDRRPVPRIFFGDEKGDAHVPLCLREKSDCDPFANGYTVAITRTRS